MSLNSVVPAQSKLFFSFFFLIFLKISFSCSWLLKILLTKLTEQSKYSGDRTTLNYALALCLGRKNRSKLKRKHKLLLLLTTYWGCVVMDIRHLQPSLIFHEGTYSILLVGLVPIKGFLLLKGATSAAN